MNPADVLMIFYMVEHDRFISKALWTLMSQLNNNNLDLIQTRSNPIGDLTRLINFHVTLINHHRFISWRHLFWSIFPPLLWWVNCIRIVKSVHWRVPFITTTRAFVITLSTQRGVPLRNLFKGGPLMRMVDRLSFDIGMRVPFFSSTVFCFIVLYSLSLTISANH